MLKCIVLCFLFSFSYAQQRKVNLLINPGCKDCGPEKNILMHVIADSQNDTLHHIWDFTYKPTVVLALTPLNTTLSIDWADFKLGKVGAMKFSHQPKLIFSFSLNHIIEFNDVNNTGIYDPTKNDSSDVTRYHAHGFDWMLDRSKLTNTTDVAGVVLEGRQHRGHPKTKGVVTVSLNAFGTLDHSGIRPHLLHTVNASQIDVVLDSLSGTYNSSRFALGFGMLSSYDFGKDIVTRKSNDDEHSPGVFTIEELRTSAGYLMWRSVAYTSRDRLMTSSTGVLPALYPLGNEHSFHHTAIGSLFGELTMPVIKSVFSFGEAGSDYFYPSSHYLSWTFVAGVGEPVDDSYSLLIKLMTVLGIGVPALLILLGITCIALKRINKQSHDIVFAEN